MSSEQMTERTCKACGAVLERRPGENNHNWGKRVTCSKECSWRATGAARRAKVAAEQAAVEPHACVYCGDPVPRKPGEPVWRWRDRHTCLKPGCHFAAPQKQKPGDAPKQCIQCGTVFTTAEARSIHRHRTKKFCSYECSVSYKGRTLPTTKQCVICGSTFGRALKQTAQQWRHINTCSKQCRYRYIAERQPEGTMPPPKQCDVCGKWFLKRKQESHPTFEAKRTCSQACKGKLLEGWRKEYPPRECPICHVMFERRENERAGNWNRRLTCSIQCQARLMVQTRNEGGERSSAYPFRWTSAEGRRLREWVRERDHRICQLCGATEGAKVHAVHHIDYEKDNIDPSNLVTLCHPCHSKTNHNRSYWEAFLTAFMAERDDIAA